MSMLFALVLLFTRIYEVIYQKQSVSSMYNGIKNSDDHLLVSLVNLFYGKHLRLFGEKMEGYKILLTVYVFFVQGTVSAKQITVTFTLG